MQKCILNLLVFILVYHYFCYNSMYITIYVVIFVLLFFAKKLLLNTVQPDSIIYNFLFIVYFVPYLQYIPQVNIQKVGEVFVCLVSYSQIYCTVYIVFVYKYRTYTVASDPVITSSDSVWKNKIIFETVKTLSMGL